MSWLSPTDSKRANEEPRSENDVFTIGSFGFLFKHKNIDLLVAAVGRLKSMVADDVRLVLLNCVTDAEQSLEAQRQTETVIDALDLRGTVGNGLFVPAGKRNRFQVEPV